MEKINKNINIALIFMLIFISMFTFLGMSFAISDSEYNKVKLRIPIFSLSKQAVQRMSEAGRIQRALKSNDAYFKVFPYSDADSYRKKAPSQILLPGYIRVTDKDYVINITIGDSFGEALDTSRLNCRPLSPIFYGQDNKIGNCHQGEAVLIKLETDEDVIGTLFLQECDAIGGKIIIKGEPYLFLYHYPGAYRNSNAYAFITWLLEQSDSPGYFECFVSVRRDFNERDLEHGVSRRAITLNEALGELRARYPKIHVEAVRHREEVGLFGAMVVSRQGAVFSTAQAKPIWSPALSVYIDWNNTESKPWLFNKPLEVGNSRSRLVSNGTDSIRDIAAERTAL